jgi:hypothetical protein
MITRVTMQQLAVFENDINGIVWKELYVRAGGSEHMAGHLWSKFVQYDHSILKLWSYLDNDNSKLIVSVINKFIARKNMR